MERKKPTQPSLFDLDSAVNPDEQRQDTGSPPKTAGKKDASEIVVPQSLPCLSIRQPWAGWNMDGERQFEVRTWGVGYRGLLLIHAGKKIDLSSHPTKVIPSNYFLQTGAILGYAILEDIARITTVQMWEELRQKTLEVGSFPESATVYAWKLSSPTRFPTLIPLRGQLGLQSVGVDKIIGYIGDVNGKDVAESTLAGLRQAQAEFLLNKK